MTLQLVKAVLVQTPNVLVLLSPLVNHAPTPTKASAVPLTGVNIVADPNGNIDEKALQDAVRQALATSSDRRPAVIVPLADFGTAPQAVQKVITQGRQTHGATDQGWNWYQDWGGNCGSYGWSASDGYIPTFDTDRYYGFSCGGVTYPVHLETWYLDNDREVYIFRSYR